MTRIVTCVTEPKSKFPPLVEVSDVVVSKVSDAVASYGQRMKLCESVEMVVASVEMVFEPVKGPVIEMP